MKKSHVAVLVVVASAVTAYVASRLLTTERQRVQRAVSRLLSRIEARDAAGVCRGLTEDYRDSHKHSRESLRSLMAELLPLASSVDVGVRDLEVALEEDETRATVTFEANVVAEPRGRTGLPPWRGASKVRLRLRKDDGAWRVYHAEYRMPRLPRR